MTSQRFLRLRWLLTALAALLLAGCATGGHYGGSYPGGGYGEPPARHGRMLHGTVQYVDHYRNRIVIASDRSGYGSRAELHYDRGTRLYYRGRQLPVEGLEPGDGIRVTAMRSDGRWWAQSIEVVYNVREGYGGGYGDRYGYGEQLRGEVLYVDPRAQVIGIERGGYGRHERIRYDHRTAVEYRGRRYRPGDLERGDLVRIDLRRWGNGWIAERVRVERDVSRR